jgi:hypothetical protein
MMEPKSGKPQKEMVAIFGVDRNSNTEKHIVFPRDAFTAGQYIEILGMDGCSLKGDSDEEGTANDPNEDYETARKMVMDAMNGHPGVGMIRDRCGSLKSDEVAVAVVLVRIS